MDDDADGTMPVSTRLTHTEIRLLDDIARVTGERGRAAVIRRLILAEIDRAFPGRRAA